MSADESPVKPRRRKPASPSSRLAAETTKLTLSVPADLARRFSIHAAAAGQSKAELFGEMIARHCTRYVVSDRARPAEEPEAAV